MNCESDFVRAIAADPDNDGPRREYARWLHGQGDSRGELIEVQLALAGEVSPDERQELEARERDLIGAVGRGLRDELCALVPRIWRHRRGLIEELDVEVLRFLQHQDRIEWLPLVRKLGLTGIASAEHAPAPGPALGSVEHLTLDVGPGGLVHFAPLLGSHYFTRLTALVLNFHRSSRPGLAQLLQAPFLPQIATLDVRCIDPFGWQIDELLTELGELPALSRLTLLVRPLTTESVARLRGCPLLEHLDRLDLRRAHATGTGSDAWTAALLDVFPTKQLSELVLRYCGLDDDGARALARAGAFPALRRLDLGDNRIGPDGARALAAARPFRALETLDVRRNPLGDAGVLDVGRAFGERLASLDVRECGTSLYGLARLLHDPALSNLRSVSFLPILPVGFGTRNRNRNPLLEGDELRRVQSRPTPLAPPEEWEDARLTFLRAIRERPDDDTLRLVYADLLEEYGDETQAAFIRLQIEVARLPPDDPNRAELDARANQLLNAHRCDWPDPTLFALFDDGSRPSFTFLRGLAGGASVGHSPPELVEAVLKLYPIRDLRVEFGREPDADVARLVAVPELRHVRGLALVGAVEYGGFGEYMAFFPLGPAGAESLARAPALAGLERLELRHHNTLSETARQVLEAAFGERLHLVPASDGWSGPLS